VSNEELLKALQEAGRVKVIPVGSYEEKGEKGE
jgi:creatinine amidohydrolase/Fe(II)-dependent formamide hydrolase-like protein